MVAEPTYRSDTRPDFAPFEESCGTITGFAYVGDLATEVAAGDIDGAGAAAKQEWSSSKRMSQPKSGRAGTGPPLGQLWLESHAVLEIRLVQSPHGVPLWRSGS